MDKNLPSGDDEDEAAHTDESSEPKSGSEETAEDDVADIQALIDTGKIQPPALTGSLIARMNALVPRIPTFASLGLSDAVSGILGDLSKRFSADVLGMSALTPHFALTESLAKTMMPTISLPNVLGPRYTSIFTAGLETSLANAMKITVDPGWADAITASALKNFDIGLLKALPSWLPDLESLRHNLPPNWAGMKVEIDDAAEQILEILSEGIPLAWVPDKRVLRLLLAAPDAQSRRKVVSNNYRGITSRCLVVLGMLPLTGRPQFLADMIGQSVRALRDGHVEAAQALATNVLDTLLSGYSPAAFGKSADGVLNAAFGKKLEKKRDWRLLLTLRPVFVVMRGRHSVHERENAFRRNATAHAVTTHQYSRINAVLAIMNATAVLTCFARETAAFERPTS